MIWGLFIFMKKLTKNQIDTIEECLKSGQSLPEEFKDLLFENKKEYELVYASKERGEDIIADTMAVPLQQIKTFGVAGKNEWTNKLIFGDNLQVLKSLYDDPAIKGNVKLIYIDPPFATKQEFRGSKEQKAYQDKLVGAQFLEFLRKRLVLLKEVLASDGSIYVHLDWKKGHYMKVLMDELFDEMNFVREIVWNRMTPSGGKAAANNWIHMHDTILYYANNAENRIFNKQYEPYSKEYITERFVHEDEKGKYRLQGNDNRKQYLSESKGRAVASVWNIPDINVMASERIDYPTQKPEVLLERIIEASSNKGDIILDAFTGAGTTLAVAEKLGRRWIGIDSSKLANYTVQKRMLNLRAKIGNNGKEISPRPFSVYNAGLYDYKLIKELPWDKYREFALKLFQCRDDNHKVSGIGLDGYLGEDHVVVFQWHDGGEIILDRGFVDDLHKTLNKKVGNRFFIIAPASTVTFLEDYIEKDNTKYYILRIPYSMIEEIHEKGFQAIKQPVSEFSINETADAVGFDFIQTPDMECDYKIRNITKQQKSLFEGKKEAVIKIKKFKSNILSHKQLEFKNLETLSMIMVDYDFDGDVFDIDQYWFAEDIAKNQYRVSLDPKKIKGKMMIIYMDIFGNEKRELKTLKDFE